VPALVNTSAGFGGECHLDAVMVRWLKEDVRKLGVEQFPKRTLVKHAVGNASSPELALAEKLAEYTQLMRPERGQGAREAFVGDPADPEGFGGAGLAQLPRLNR